MRAMVLAWAIGFSLAAFADQSVSLPTLPSAGYADTESVTNCPFSCADVNVRHLLVKLELVATSSNRVEIAFGRDGDADGRLSVDEIALAVGWDGGSWIVREGPATGNGELASWTAPAATPASHKRLAFALGLTKTGPKAIVAAENDVPLVWNLPQELPGWMFDPAWNTLRLAVRGVDAPNETLWAKAKINSTVVTIK